MNPGWLAENSLPSDVRRAAVNILLRETLPVEEVLSLNMFMI